MKIQYVHATSYSLDELDLADITKIGWGTAVLDTYQFSTDITFDHQARGMLYDVSQHNANLAGSLISKSVLNDFQLYSDNLVVVIEELLQDTNLLESDITFRVEYLEELISAYLIASEISQKGEFLANATATFVFFDSINTILYDLLHDTNTLDAEVTNKLEAYQSLISTMLYDMQSVSTGLSVILSDTSQMSDDISTSAFFYNLLHDTYTLGTYLKFEGQEYLAYVVNTQSKGISTFENFGFNSFSYPYAATNEGIYKLDEGITDDGTAIDCTIKTGLMDFGTALKKQVPYAYLGIQEDGRVLLKTVSNDRGIKKERWYEVQSYTNATDTTRVQMGKGVKAKYWQFELSNIEGESLSLESMEVLPLVLKRRKQ